MSQNPSNKETLQLIREVASAVKDLTDGYPEKGLGRALRVIDLAEEMIDSVGEVGSHEDAAHGWWQHSLALEAHYEKARVELIEFYVTTNRISRKEMTAKINELMTYVPPTVEEIPVEPDEEFTRVPDVEGRVPDDYPDRAATSTFD